MQKKLLHKQLQLQEHKINQIQMAKITQENKKLVE
jgi:hypothetical protein